MTGATRSFLLLVAIPFVTSSFLLIAGKSKRIRIRIGCFRNTLPNSKRIGREPALTISMVAAWTRADRLPNYRVRMGFGLHSGWAIEAGLLQRSTGMAAK